MWERNSTFDPRSYHQHMASGTSKMGGWPKTEISKMRGWRWEVDYPRGDIYSSLLEQNLFAPHDSKQKIIAKQYECPLEIKKKFNTIVKRALKDGWRVEDLKDCMWEYLKEQPADIAVPRKYSICSHNLAMFSKVNGNLQETSSSILLYTTEDEESAQRCTIGCVQS